MVKFTLKFVSIFETGEVIHYYNAVLDRQLLQHKCQAVHTPNKCYNSSQARTGAYQSCYNKKKKENIYRLIMKQ
jgi:hypothetical protein